MSMKPSLQLRIGQQLTMTPQLRQAIRLLQLSSLELHTEIQTQLDSNMMLEPEEDLGDVTREALSATPPAAPSTPNNNADEAHSSALNEHGMQDESATDTKAATEANTDATTDTQLSSETLPDELPVDTVWEDVWEPPSSTNQRAETDNSDYYEVIGAQREQSLQQYLYWQLDLSAFTDVDYRMAQAIINAVGDDGYLESTLEDLLLGVQDTNDTPPVGDDFGDEFGDEFGDAFGDGFGLEEAETVLHRIQRFDPVGVACTSPAESLSVQFAHLYPTHPLQDVGQRIIHNHLALLASSDLKRIQRRQKLDEEQLTEVIALIRSLSPHPGRQVAINDTRYIAPDVYVRRQKNAWSVELSNETAVKLRVNPLYAGFVQRGNPGGKAGEENSRMKEHLQEARWFIKSLHSRNETLLKVASAIVRRQQGFLEQGDEAMTPMVLRDIAEDVELHESTVSRVTSQKYMHTPRGIYEFKYFFSSHVATSAGGECSAIAIRARIKKLVSEEPARKPLSDNKLATLLCNEGIEVARRTVAKYRETMNIPPSNERKRLDVD